MNQPFDHPSRRAFFGSSAKPWILNLNCYIDRNDSFEGPTKLFEFTENENDSI